VFATLTQRGNEDLDRPVVIVRKVVTQRTRDLPGSGSQLELLVAVQRFSNEVFGRKRWMHLPHHGGDPYWHVWPVRVLERLRHNQEA
jgi:hypothetical protein